MPAHEKMKTVEREPRTIDNYLSNHNISLNTDDSKRPIIEKEIVLDPSKTIMSKTDPKGIIEYANDYFMEISGYEEYELMGQPHSIIRHPDMPKVIFKELWRRLKKGENIHALVKNRAKDGRFYWVLTDFEIKYNEQGEIVSYYARRKAAPGHAVYQIEKLYKTLRSIEMNQSVNVAERYFFGLLEEKGVDYDQFILSILGVKSDELDSYYKPKNLKTIPKKTKKKKGLISKLFKK